MKFMKKTNCQKMTFIHETTQWFIGKNIYGKHKKMWLVGKNLKKISVKELKNYANHEKASRYVHFMHAMSWCSIGEVCTLPKHLTSTQSIQCTLNWIRLSMLFSLEISKKSDSYLINDYWCSSCCHYNFDQTNIR